MSELKSLVDAFSDAAEKGSSAFLIGFGAALTTILTFVETELSGTALVVAVGGSALVMIAGGVLRVSSLWVSSKTAAEVKIATMNRAFESADDPPKLVEGT